MQQQFRLQIKQRVALLITVLLLFIVSANVAVMAQNLGGAPQVNVAVQGQTGAQPEGAFLNLVNWIGNVIAPVGAGLALAGWSDFTESRYAKESRASGLLDRLFDQFPP